MIVCHCHAVTDHAIRKAVQNGACSARAVGAACGAGTGCGGCQELVEHIVETEGGAPRSVRALAMFRAESLAEAP